jgi:DNA-binding HxlR family transcriptional regulator
MLDLIGGKWKEILLFRILEETRRFNELRRLVPGLTQRMLTNQLRELERDGLIERKIYAEVPPKVEYTITVFGKTLEPVLFTLKEWSETHMLPIMESKKISINANDPSCADQEKKNPVSIKNTDLITVSGPTGLNISKTKVANASAKEPNQNPISIRNSEAIKKPSQTTLLSINADLSRRLANTQKANP